MAQFEQHFVQDLTQQIKVRHCGSIVFNDDNESNVVSVRLFNGSEPVAISGSVVGAVVCSDGSTVPLTGSYSGNTASITLTGDCFAVLGQIGVGIQIVNGTQKTTVLKAKYNVETLTTENVVDPGSRITLGVGNLINDIETATAAIPASDMASLMSGIAPTFSDSVAYKAGAYVYYSGNLYCFTADHNGGTWTGSDVTAAVLCNDVSDLKSHFGQVSSGVIGVNLASQIALEDGKALNEDGEVVNNSVAVLSDFIQVIPGYIYTVNQKLGSSVYCNCFYDSSFTLVESHLSNGTLPLTYTAPEGAKYLRAIGVKADKAAFEVMAVLTADGKSLANIDEIEQLKADAARIKYITPEEYGAKGDGVTDDRAAFVAMFDDANDYDTIVLGNKEYYISSNITVAKNFLKICSAFHRDEYRPCLSTNLSAAANVLLTFTGSGISIYDICFKNTSKAATFLYFDADNETANGNIDALVNNVCFMTGDAGVRTKGRNVRVYDCLFSNLNAAVRLNQTTLDTDNRGFEIVNNRIHYCGIVVQNGIDNARDNHNIVIANNFADGTAMLFTGKGGGVVIKDNVVDAYGSDNATFIVIEADQSGVLNRISGNVYHGIGASENRGIECRIGAVVDIVGNMLDGCDGLGLVIQGTSKIIDNTFTDCGSGSNMYVMAFGSQSNAVVVGNVMSGFANKYSVTSGGVVNYANNYPA